MIAHAGLPAGRPPLAGTLWLHARGPPVPVHFEHRYEIHPEGSGSRIDYIETIQRLNYVPYWLKPWMRPLTRLIVNRADRKQLSNLARLAEERSAR